MKQRPSYVESRKTRGHWEGDTIISRKDKQALVTLVERKTGLVLIGRLNQRTASETRDMIIKLLTPFEKMVKSITFDNGTEFNYHHAIEHYL
ncbi:IS30 family transposase, partial [Gilliamella sp. Imp1-1]|uniref:IS30 family transposase n=1 Tax=Gilliamella sp. Imp1-1 TaxID=3120248 RepID=UPI0021006677